jgi:ankyrin repeat protein
MAVGAPREESTILSLLHMGADIDAKTSRAKNTALHLAVKLHRQKVLKLLLDKGAYTEAENREGNVPLQDAVLHDNYEAISLLLDNGADIEAKSIFGKRALRMAAGKGNLVTLNLLLARGADINAQSGGQAPLHAEGESSGARVAATLLDKGANIHEKSSEG